MPSPSSQRQLIIDQLIHRVTQYANATVTDSVFRFMSPDGYVFNENVIYIVAGAEDASESEYGEIKIKSMAIAITLIVAKADNPEREFEAMVKAVRDIIERDPELKITASDATSALCLQIVETGLTQPEYSENIYIGQLNWNCRYQYSAGSA